MKIVCFFLNYRIWIPFTDRDHSTNRDPALISDHQSNWSNPWIHSSNCTNDQLLSNIGVNHSQSADSFDQMACRAQAQLGFSTEAVNLDDFQSMIGSNAQSHPYADIQSRNGIYFENINI